MLIERWKCCVSVFFVFNLYHVATSVFVVKWELNFNSLLLPSPTCILFIQQGHIRLIIHTSQPDLSKAVELIAWVGSSPQLFHLSLSLLSVCHHSPFPLESACTCKLNCCYSLPPNGIMLCLPTWASVGKVLDSCMVLRGFFYYLRWLDCFSGSVPPKFEHKLHRH